MRLMTRTLMVVTICLALIQSATPTGAVLAQDTKGSKKDDSEKKDKKDKKDKGKKDKDTDSTGKGTTVLWEEPTDIERRDLFYGIGGADGAPDPHGKFTFVDRVKSGTSEKIHVTDDKGRKWQVKFGPEAKPAPAAARIMWALGYHTDIDYFVARTHIEGRGGFDVWDVRFKRSDDGFKEDGLWSWHVNPFNGTRELQGLKVLMALLNNWDLKEVNNKIVHPSKKSGGDKNQEIYYVSDLGAALGKTGTPFKFIPNAPAGSKGDAADFANQPFILGTKNGQVLFNYKGKDPKALEGITVEHARWMGDLIGRLSDKQLSDAFRAGGFSDSDVATYVRAVRNRINQLKNLR
jgi:hypothetical protein